MQQSASATVAEAAGWQKVLRLWTWHQRTLSWASRRTIRFEYSACLCVVLSSLCCYRDHSLSPTYTVTPVLACCLQRELTVSLHVASDRWCHWPDSCVQFVCDVSPCWSSLMFVYQLDEVGWHRLTHHGPPSTQQFVLVQDESSFTHDPNSVSLTPAVTNTYTQTVLQRLDCDLRKKNSHSVNIGTAVGSHTAQLGQ